MLAETQLQLQSAQHSVLFLQNEHAKTIEGLHEEIRNLQKRCGELNFQLAASNARSSGNDNEDLANRETMKAAQDVMQKDMAALRGEIINLKTVVETKDKRISLLEGQLKGKEQKFQSELKLAQKSASELKNEIDAKSNTIAYLTNQLHQMKTRATKTDKVNSENISMVPVPPREGAPSRTRNMRRSTTPVGQNMSSESLIGLTSHQFDTSEFIFQTSVPSRSRNLPSRPPQSLSNPARPALGHSAVKRERGLHLIPKQRPSDYKEFISSQSSNDTELLARPTVDPLPPISVSKTSKNLPSSNSRYKHSEETMKHVCPTGSSGEITEMVVEPLSSPERTWRKMQNSNSRQ